MEKLLDRNEGVSRGFYCQAELDVEARLVRTEYKTEYVQKKLDRGFDLVSVVGPVERVASSSDEEDSEAGWNYNRGREELRRRGYQKDDATYAANDPGDQPSHDYDSRRAGHGPSATPHQLDHQDANRAQRTVVPALVYLSETYCTDGEIRAEYVARMRNAMGDARTLGISSRFLELYLEPAVHGSESRSPQDRVERAVPVERTRPGAARGGGNHIDRGISSRNDRKRTYPKSPREVSESSEPFDDDDDKIRRHHRDPPAKLRGNRRRSDRQPSSATSDRREPTNQQSVMGYLRSMLSGW